MTPNTHNNTPIQVSPSLNTNLHKTLVRVLPRSPRSMVRYAALSTTEVFNRVVPSGCTTGKYESWTFFNNVYANVTPARLRTFKRNPTCVCCGRVGNVFLVERHVNDHSTQNLNLYAMNNHNLHLMTVDHILPDSLGGRYAVSNFQTMCRTCNSDKQNMMSVDDIQTVLSDVEKYAKSWVDKRLLTMLLQVQYQLHVAKPHHKPKYMKVFNKYRMAVRYSSPQINQVKRANKAVNSMKVELVKLKLNIALSNVTSKVVTTITNILRPSLVAHKG